MINDMPRNGKWFFSLLCLILLIFKGGKKKKCMHLYCFLDEGNRIFVFFLFVFFSDHGCVSTGKLDQE